MGRASLRYVQTKAAADAPDHSEQEKHALHVLRKEARIAGATLASGGKGGLPTDMVLGAMRRDGFRCKACGKLKGLGVHHIGGIVSSPRVSRMGHKTLLKNLATICDTPANSTDGKSCHDRLHDAARAEGIDSSQVTPIGDR